MGRYLIPDDVMIPILQAKQRDEARCCDNFTTYDWEQIRHWCGTEYAGVPLDDVRRQGVNLRKRGVLGSVNGHGPSKRQELSDEYKAALRRPEFREYFKTLCELFGWRCAVCNSADKLEPHHRTYEHLGSESKFDCIPVCRKCHKVCDTRRRRQAQYTHQVRL